MPKKQASAEVEPEATVSQPLKSAIKKGKETKVTKDKGGAEAKPPKSKPRLVLFEGHEDADAMDIPAECGLVIYKSSC